ncbi:MAG: HPF/RaiA family ribosome-associated protein [Parafilimonas sp.]
MNIIIKSIDFKAGNTLETFIKEKVKKLFAQCDNIIRANVILRKQASKSHENKLCEIRLVVPGNDHYVKKISGGYRKSVSHSVDVLQEILRRNKRR